MKCEPSTVGKASLGINTTVHSDSPDLFLGGRRHTSSLCDWSSDVCSYDHGFALPDVTFYFFAKGTACTNGDTTGATQLNTLSPTAAGLAHQIGRASCRERG